jgi:hypothetical protein
MGLFGALKGKSSAQKETEAAQQGLIKSMAPMGPQFMGEAQEAISPVMQHWLSILGGNRQEMTGAQAPEIQQITQGYRTAGETASTLTPRGGGRASLLSMVPYRQAGDINNLLMSARPQAAAGLTQVGGLAGQLGGTALGSTVSALGGAQNYQLADRKMGFEQGQSLGGVFSELLKQLIGSFGKKGGGAGPMPPAGAG